MGLTLCNYFLCFAANFRVTLEEENKLFDVIDNEVEMASKKLKRKNPSNAADDLVSIFSALQSINKDCLRQICQYLEIMYVVNLATTCRILRNFAEAVIFPKIAKKLAIGGEEEMQIITSLWLNTSVCTPKCLETGFSYFGKFVDEIELAFEPISWCSTEIAMKNCKNLKILKVFCDYKLTARTIRELVDIITVIMPSL